MNIIALEKLNAILANIKSDEAIKDFNQKNKRKNIDSIQFLADEKPHLMKLTLKQPLFKKNSGVPFYAFVKSADNGYIIVVDVITGAAKVIENSIIDSEADAGRKFRINGVTYGLQDTVNGFKRYCPLSVEPRKPRQRLTPNSKAVVYAVVEEEEMQKADLEEKAAEMDPLPNEESEYYIEEDELDFED